MAPSGSSSIKRSCRRVLYWIPVLFITMIVGWSYYAYVIQLCIGSITNIGEKVVCVVAYHLFFIMFAWAYWKTIFTMPMNPSKEFHLSYTDREILEREERGETQQEVLRRIAKDLPIYTGTMSGAIRYCDRCQLVKPDRCHHCSVCDNRSPHSSGELKVQCPPSDPMTEPAGSSTPRKLTADVSELTTSGRLASRVRCSVMR